MMKRYAGMFIVGALFGAISTTAYVTRDMDHLRDTVQALRQDNDQLQNENALLREQTESLEPKRLLDSIKVDVISPKDRSQQAAIRSRVIQSLSFLQGKPIHTLNENPEIPTNIVNNQTMVLGTLKFRLRATLVIISDDELILHVSGRIEQ